MIIMDRRDAVRFVRLASQSENFQQARPAKPRCAILVTSKLSTTTRATPLAWPTSPYTKHDRTLYRSHTESTANMPGKITSVTSSSHFSQLLSQSTYTVVDFYADWCGPCKAIAPVFQSLAEKESKPGKLQFVKVDVDSQQEVA